MDLFLCNHQVDQAILKESSQKTASFLSLIVTLNLLGGFSLILLQILVRDHDFLITPTYHSFSSVI